MDNNFGRDRTGSVVSRNVITVNSLSCTQVKLMMSPFRRRYRAQAQPTDANCRRKKRPCKRSTGRHLGRAAVGSAQACNTSLRCRTERTALV